MQILRAQSSQAGSMQHGITLTPTLSVGIDIMGIGVVVVSIMGLLGVAKGCKRLMNLYFMLVLCFIAIQVVYAIAGFMSGTNWILEALEKSWDRAYNTDEGLIRDLQTEFHCQGFSSQDDRAVLVPRSVEGPIPFCADILQQRFGKRLRRLGSLILCIRLIQLTGVLLLSILFKHLAMMEQTEDEQADSGDEEFGYFKSEKQLEDESARVPLLSCEDEDLPRYSVEDAHGEVSEGSYDDSDDDSDDDAECEESPGRFDTYHYYRGLSECADDKFAPQVFVQ
ncbi:hypothetical protein BGZ70_000330 [Mortierella alpina]|uniref:Uncharacterized protein n=1 Tax=Mortierella alpina TaxID=64518 RepID=A0A9P6JCA9_MORAP|nr:hypothetical protein BGZ70_000330 [Mortierella alpina]